MRLSTELHREPMGKLQRYQDFLAGLPGETTKEGRKREGRESNGKEVEGGKEGRGRDAEVCDLQR